MPLRCPDCRTALTVADVFTAAVDSPWPEEQIVAFPCGACRAPLHARLRDGLGEIVTRSGAGLYRVHFAESEPELAAAGSPARVEVWLAGEHRSIGRRSRVPASGRTPVPGRSRGA